jgi:hypothetical protein
MTTPALATSFAVLLMAAVSMSPQSALAGQQAAGPEAAPAARQVLSPPESPAAAFERLLAVRTPTPSAAVAPDSVEPLQPYFQAALWRTQAQAPFRTAAAGKSPEVRK